MQNPTDEVFQLLCNWNHIYLYDYFVNNQINMDSLKIITEKDLDTIFSDKMLGSKIGFRKENNIPNPDVFMNNIKKIVEQVLEAKSNVQAEPIVKVSPKNVTNLNLYYQNPPNGADNPSGILYNKYYNAKRRMKKRGLSIESNIQTKTVAQSVQRAMRGSKN